MGHQDSIPDKWAAYLPAVVPIVASTFAFSFVVGYFIAFDISWFPFFSLSEHVVFALRALPIAIAASVLFLIAIHPQIRKKREGNRYRPVFVAWWIWVLVVAAILAVLSAHFALFLSFCVIALGAYFYSQNDDEQTLWESVLYWAITMTVLTLIVGYVSAFSWQFAWRVDKCVGHHIFGLSPSLTVRLKDAVMDKNVFVGQIIFVGNAGVLFYEYRTGTTHLFRQGNVKDISDDISVRNTSDKSTTTNQSSAKPGFLSCAEKIPGKLKALIITLLGLSPTIQ
jgi:hypothetical protein